MTLFLIIATLLLLATVLPSDADSRGYAFAAPLAGITIDWVSSGYLNMGPKAV